MGLMVWFSVPYVSHQAAVALLFASLSCSIMSAFSTVTFLSATSYSNPAELESMWKLDKIVFVILLTGPPAWINHALLCFKMLLLVIVWMNDDTPAKIIVLMGFKVLQLFALRILANGLILTLSHLFFVENLDYLRRGHKQGFAPKDGRSLSYLYKCSYSTPGVWELCFMLSNRAMKSVEHQKGHLRISHAKFQLCPCTQSSLEMIHSASGQ